MPAAIAPADADERQVSFEALEVEGCVGAAFGFGIGCDDVPAAVITASARLGGKIDGLPPLLLAAI
jgi:hypothetical protein